ncbi:hypothetical protein ABZV58_03470 [Nocardia sp. NPDC004654]|uniref:hypothetical protein n=1 Tax=Nocardia sp. NPDC004654 TaxID=3154776 RepID=UPI0033B4DEB3
MAYPTQQPHGNFGPQGSGPYGPPKKGVPGWVWVAAVFGAILFVGLIGTALGGGEREKSVEPAAAPVAAVPTSAARVPVAAVPTSEAVRPTSTQRTTAVAAPAVQVPMPNVVCMNLQAAQDAIQAAGVFYSRSTDATGAGRMQIMDRNWIVIGQNPAPGVLIGEGDAVLSVVKYGETRTCG